MTAVTNALEAWDMHLKTKELILCALFIALVTVGTFIKIPVGTDVYTLQFLFTLLAGLLLGPRLGAIPDNCPKADLWLSAWLHCAGVGEWCAGTQGEGNQLPLAYGG